MEQPVVTAGTNQLEEQVRSILDFLNQWGSLYEQFFPLVESTFTTDNAQWRVYSSACAFAMIQLGQLCRQGLPESLLEEACERIVMTALVGPGASYFCQDVAATIMKILDPEFKVLSRIFGRTYISEAEKDSVGSMLEFWKKVTNNQSSPALVSHSA